MYFRAAIEVQRGPSDGRNPWASVTVIPCQSHFPEAPPSPSSSFEWLDDGLRFFFTERLPGIFEIQSVVVSNVAAWRCLLDTSSGK